MPQNPDLDKLRRLQPFSRAEYQPWKSAGSRNLQPSSCSFREDRCLQVGGPGTFNRIMFRFLNILNMQKAGVLICLVVVLVLDGSTSLQGCQVVALVRASRLQI